MILNWLWFYIVTWKNRHLHFYELAQQYSLTLKAARRCAYDLKHAVGTMDSDSPIYPLYRESAEMWLKIFQPDGNKDYRHDLHHKINSQEYEIHRLKKLLEENGISTIDPEHPF